MDDKYAKEWESPPPEHEGLVLLCASEIVPECITWLWEGWMARGKLAILAGSPGTGKTTIAIGLAATMTTAGLWPDKTPCMQPGNVLIWSGEDDPADTITPRLIAAGADLSRVHFVKGIRKGGEVRPFDPGHDILHLAAALETVGDVSLIIIDPIVSAVTGDGHKANDVRRGLQPLVSYAMRHRCAVLGITHFSKGSSGRQPLERVIGSQAFGALARVVWVTAKEDGKAGQRVMARAKSNIGPDEGGVSYQVEDVETGNGIRTSRITWKDCITGSASEILAELEGQDAEAVRSATDEAADFLLEALAQRGVPALEVKTAAKLAGISYKCLRRAGKRLGVVTQKSGFEGGWVWRLPGTQDATSDPQDAQGALPKSGASSEVEGIFETGKKK